MSYALDEEDDSACLFIAFDAGNLVAVAEAIRARSPSVDIILLADNDRNRMENIGIVKARIAASKVGGRLIIPEFPKGAPFSLSDYNDWRNYWNDHENDSEVAA